MAFFTLKHSAAAYRADFACYGAAVLALAVWLPAASPRALWLAMGCCLAAGLFAWTAIEYALHRFVLHGMPPFRRWHAEHHRQPRALITTPTVLSAALIVALVFLPALLLAGGWYAGALTLGVLAGYFAYAVTHHVIHHRPDSGAWAAQRWHAQHHRMLRARYGVTTALWDHLFRTALIRAPPDGGGRPREGP